MSRIVNIASLVGIRSYITRARECLPTSVVHQSRYPLDWSAPGDTLPMTLRYEAMGWVRGRCHVARTQLQPSWEWPDAGPRPKASMEVLDWEYWQRAPFRTALGAHAPLMQCLYEGSQARARWCGEEGQEVLDCDFFWPERRRARLRGPPDDRGPPPP